MKLEQKISELNLAKNVFDEFGLSDNFAKVLLSRNIDSKEKIEKFLHPSFEHFSSPFDILGMKEAVVIIKNAILYKKNILIYGDYDCDGISAISILMLYLKSQNANVSYFIPDRNVDGYGMNIETLKRLMKETKIELLITVDTGITSCKEVEFLQENGIEVVVTDHHEPQEKIPNCVVVDPKIEKKGFYEFCGAGVALKLVEALSSRENLKNYIDIAGIATVADIVPLVGENRAISKLGIDKLNSNMRKGIELLLETKKCTSFDIMFKLAPRINAAGRMDNAMKVVDLFLSDEHFVLKGLAEELNKDNQNRQEICEKVVNDAKKMLEGVNFAKTGIIVLSSPEWEGGVLGIASARLVEEFNRPTILFQDKDGKMKGSARSVKDINVFEVMSKFKNYFTSFGGHSQAAGVGILSENFEKFKNEINNYVLQNFDSKCFEKYSYFDFELNFEDDLLSFAKELELLEPTGYQNPKPSFCIELENANFEKIGTTNHIKSKNKNFEMIGFSKLDFALSCKCLSKFEVSVSRNVFQNNEYAQAIIKNVWIENLNAIDEEDLKEFAVSNWKIENDEKNSIQISKNDVEKMLQQKFGTLLVCFSKEKAIQLQNQFDLPIFVGQNFNRNPENQIVVCPVKNFEFSYFENVVFFEKMSICNHNFENEKPNVFEVENLNKITLPMIDDELLRNCFVEIRNISKKLNFCSYENLVQKLSQLLNISKLQTKIAIEILSELKLVSFEEKNKIAVSSHKTDLNLSKLYLRLKKN